MDCAAAEDVQAECAVGVVLTEAKPFSRLRMAFKSANLEAAPLAAYYIWFNAGRLVPFSGGKVERDPREPADQLSCRIVLIEAAASPK